MSFDDELDTLAEVLMTAVDELATFVDKLDELGPLDVAAELDLFVVCNVLLETFFVELGEGIEECGTLIVTEAG